jgi:uncharacterized protein (DUF305 family)
LCCLLALLVAVSACGGGEDKDQSTDELRRERAFLRLMAARQHAGIELAEIAVEGANAAEVRRLAREMIRRQSRDIIRLDATHRDLFDEGLEGDETAYEELGLSRRDVGSPHSHARLQELRRSEPLDRKFLDRMLDSHRAAIRITRALLRDVDGVELRSLAQELLRDYRREAEAMSVIRTLGPPS